MQKLILYSMPGCPMCDMLASQLNVAGIEYAKVTDREVLKEKGITHVPMLQLDDGRLIGVADAMKYIKEKTT